MKHWVINYAYFDTRNFLSLCQIANLNFSNNVHLMYDV